jgi:predicted DNA-binding ribbon-helix-helix protein
MSLRRAWYLYFLALGGFLASAYSFPSPNGLQLGALVFSIFVLYLIMVTSNRELQRSAKLQSDALVAELQRVGSELRNVTSHLREVVSVMEGVRQLMAEQSRLQGSLIEQERVERDRHVSRLRPIISLSVGVTGGTLLFFDWRHHSLTALNSGGDCQDLVLTSQTGRTFGPWRLGRGRTETGDLGPFNQMPAGSNFSVQVSCRDTELRGYAGAAVLIEGQASWVAVQMVPTD